MLWVVVAVLPGVTTMQPEMKGSFPELLDQSTCPNASRLPTSNHNKVCVLDGLPVFSQASFQETAPFNDPLRIISVG
jgi:hypothetical protein